MTQHRCDTLANPWTAHQLSTFTTFATHPAVYLGSSNSIVTVVLILSQRVSPSIILMLQTSSLRAESHAHYLTHNQKLGLRKYKTTPSSTTFTYFNCRIGRKTDQEHIFVNCQKMVFLEAKLLNSCQKFRWSPRPGLVHDALVPLRNSTNHLNLERILMRLTQLIVIVCWIVQGRYNLMHSPDLPQVNNLLD